MRRDMAAIDLPEKYRGKNLHHSLCLIAITALHGEITDVDPKTKEIGYSIQKINPEIYLGLEIFLSQTPLIELLDLKLVYNFLEYIQKNISNVKIKDCEKLCFDQNIPMHEYEHIFKIIISSLKKNEENYRPYFGLGVLEWIYNR